MSSGTVVVKDKDITHVPIEDRNIGIVFQSYALFPTMTVYDNIAFGLKIKKLKKAEIDAKVRDIARKVDLSDEQLQKAVSQLSGGQQQRVAIARALATEPEIIYFDEPTSALDPELIGEVLAVMRQLAEDGMTMLVVTHELSFAQNVSNHVIFMENGSIVEQGPSGELFANPREQRTRDFLKNIRTQHDA